MQKKNEIYKKKKSFKRANKRYLRAKRGIKKRSTSKYNSVKKIKLPKYLSTMSQKSEFIDKMKEAELDINKTLSFNKTTNIDISAGIYLKAFCDHLNKEHNGYKIECSKSNRKIREVLQYLDIRDYNLSITHADIKCWEVNMWDLHKEIPDIPKTLMLDILPKTLNGKIPSENFSSIASALQEILSNCIEHAYSDNDIFKQFYLFAGEYLNTDNYTFIVLDRGKGFKETLKKGGLKMHQSESTSEGKLIKAAVNGQSGAGTKKDGRGKGLSSVLEKIKQMDGRFFIYSGYGYYGYKNNKEREEHRLTSIKGSMISLTIPISK